MLDPFLNVARTLVQALFGAQRQLRRLWRRVRRGARIVRHLIAYRAPDELESCPVCGASAPSPLLPIPLKGRARTYGFASGCGRCGVVFANPLPSATEVAMAYTPDGDWGRHRQDEQEKQVSRNRLERLFEPVADTINVLAPATDAAVLDFGCGLGGMLDAFASLGWQTYGIEPAMKAAFVRHRELTEIPSSERFAVAVLHHVLEHVTNPQPILRKIGAAVREGGVLLVSVPNLDDVATHGDLKYCIRAGVHVLAYTSASLAWLLADAGFEVVGDRSELSTGRRHRIILARRTKSAVPKPAAPLDAAREALRRYESQHGERSTLTMMPVRVRAALLDLQRTEWRV